jgi:fucose permease
MLAAFFLAIALPEFMWSTFPPILSVVAERFGLGPAAASFPIICFSIGTVLFTGVAGRTIDRRGYTTSIRIGLSLMTVCAGLRSWTARFGCWRSRKEASAPPLRSLRPRYRRMWWTGSKTSGCR